MAHGLRLSIHLVHGPRLRQPRSGAAHSGFRRQQVRPLPDQRGAVGWRTQNVELTSPLWRASIRLTLSSSRAFSLRACGAHLSQCPQFPREAFRDVSGICERTTRRAAGISLGAWAYYDHPYYGDPCIIWTGYALERRRLSTRAELGSTLPLVGRVGAKRRGGGRAVIR